ncbi:putative nuclear pore complex subunit Nup133 [Aspergillus saccharolyticus JOP 1030-1]|uniref:Uncharacterized protein n=1 Tax=Aspergillus saccharolyticus JOP 1030-1 TaxID=1450539 RepID=A0A318ZE16_9EURO|nr:hypothetical protein BP01DRAFT_348122 [Aspergillus saccharolyticus JOP 1030-1]PYH41790.1 hypothetical protein BP01DRAFT_348122 [Aspergillus saccharolyticus JOP 1030-1]
MFVPKAALGPTAALRNSRRRQRTNSDETTHQPNAKRQRSALRQVDTETLRNGYVESQLENVSLSTGHIDLVNAGFTATDSADTHKEIPIRAARRPAVNHGELRKAVILSQTDFYRVEQLPALPDQVIGFQSEPCRVVFGKSHGLALALTRSYAIIWRYSPDTRSQNADVITLRLPESCKGANNTAPLGQLLSTATDGLPGLIVVAPNSGHIFYWETITGATALGYTRQKLCGLQGSINGLLSGEQATEVINCEPSGIIIRFCTGRAAHVTVRDPQGKPAVTASFLRNPSTGANIGFLGGLRNAFGGGYWRRDIAAIQAGQSHQRGQREVVIATTRGSFEIWDTHWNNGSLLKKQFDVRNLMLDTLGHDSHHLEESNIEVLDFVFAAMEPITYQSQGSEPSMRDVLVVVATTTASSQELFLQHLRLSEEAQILSSTAIKHRGSMPYLHAARIKLHVPHPGNMGFLVVGQSIILLSLSDGREVLDGIPLDNIRQRGAFHDVINLRSGREYDILGTGCEHRNIESADSACLIMVRGFGILRISALAREKQEAILSAETDYITAKHRIEQAIFYGTIMENPLDLTSKDGLGFPIGEIERAALEVANEVLRSTSKYIPTTSISVDQSLKLRAKALDDLSFLLMQQQKVLDRSIWWELLWGAEKIAAQRAVWKLEESWRKQTGEDQTPLFDVLESMSERFKTQHDSDSDKVRHWFLYDTFQLEHIVPWIYKSIKPLKGNSMKQGWRTMERLLRASELSLAVLETAYRYRDEHASRYGITDGYLEDGVLTGNYKGLPEFWTSRSMGYVETVRLLDLELDSCRAWIQQRTGAADAPANDTLKKIATNGARQFHILGQMHRERVSWLAAQEDPKLIDEGISVEQTHVKQRKWQLFKLAGIGHLDEAIKLAENFKDMEALVELMIELQDQIKSQSVPSYSPISTARDLESASHQLSKKISGYFERFGQVWAEAFFSRQISLGQAGVLFAMKKFQPHVTQFLRNHSAYSRLSWINDAVGENDYDKVAESLEKLALRQELDLWGHRVELSLAKLAKLAGWEHSSSPSNLKVQRHIRRLEDLAEIDAVQEVIFASIAPTIQCAIDQKAGVDMAVSSIVGNISKDRPSLVEIMREAITKIVSRQVLNVDELLDLLTLARIPGTAGNDQDAIIGKEDYLALRVLRLSSHAQQNPQLYAVLGKLVWKRCMIKDDWVEVGRVAEEMGSDSEHLLHSTALARTLDWCQKDRLAENPSCSSLYIPQTPQDVILSDSELTILTARFSLEQRARIHHDLEKENELMLHYIDCGKLDFWFKTLFESVHTSQSMISFSSAEHSLESGLQLHEMPSSPNRKAQLNWL